MDEQLKNIIGELKTIYEERLSEDELYFFAREIQRLYFEDRAGLEGLPNTIVENEFAAGITQVRDSKVSDVFEAILYLLEENAETTHRLYELFVFHRPTLFVLIMLMDRVKLNAEWLTEEELKAVKRKAWSVLDRDTLRYFGYDWENI